MDNNERLQHYLDYIEANIVDATDFAKEQAPLVVQELIQWEICKGTIAGILLLVILIMIPVLLYTGFAKMKQPIDDSTGQWDKGFLTVLTGLLLALPLLFLTPAFFSGLKAYIAPRLVVLEQVRELVRQ